MYPPLLFVRELCSDTLAYRGNNTFHGKYEKRVIPVIPEKKELFQLFQTI
jgi:hypothetical protein